MIGGPNIGEPRNQKTLAARVMRTRPERVLSASCQFGERLTVRVGKTAGAAGRILAAPEAI